MPEFPEYKDETEQKKSIIITWFKVIIISAITGVILYKILISPIDLSAFDFSDLLSLILAIFSVLLSVMFYYKATDTSNLFYDNTYKFTKDISIILGRIEAGFGERLKHLDEGYSGLRDKIYQTPSVEASTKVKIKQEEEELDKVKNERDSIIRELVERTELQEQEKEKFYKSLKEKERELELTRNTVNILRSQLNDQSTQSENVTNNDMFKVLDYLYNKLNKNIDPKGIGNSPKLLRKYFLNIRADLNPGWIEDAQILGIVNSDGYLTEYGIQQFINYIIFRQKHQQGMGLVR